MDSQKKNLIELWRKQEIDEKLIKAFINVHREDFVLPDYIEQSYGDYPLGIGYEQTISQPSTVMLMLKYLGLNKGMKVLEIGAGSGYNAALIGKIVGA